jgi:hypothetical protein
MPLLYEAGRVPDAACLLDARARAGIMPSNRFVPVAQLDRALASGAKGYRFDSCRG